MGPFDEAELKSKWARGELLPIDYVYDDVKQDWVLLSERFPWAKEEMPHEAELTAPPPLTEATMRRPRTNLEAAHIPAPAVANTPIPTVTSTPTTTPIPTLAPTPAQANSVKIVDGVGEIEIPGLNPGEFELGVQESALELQNRLHVHIKSAEPQSLEWNMPNQQTVGEDVEIRVQALDGANRPCINYDDIFVIRINGGDGNQISVPLKQGQAILRIQHTKAELWKLSLHYSGSRSLRMPDECTLDWQPGPATKLILEGPQEYSAGHPMKVQVRAVDKFGNLAKTFHGTVVLEVKAS